MSVYSLVLQTDKVSIKPHEIVGTIKNSVKRYLVDNFENKILSSGLYIIKIIDIDTSCINHGSINELNGSVTYSVKYSAYVFDPLIGSTFEIVVTKSNDLGIWGYPKLCPNNGIIECISSTSSKKDKMIAVGDIIRLKILNRQIEFNKIMIFGLVD
jgi:DNA-directed RNA polymerase subunit E'/Rpb7